MSVPFCFFSKGKGLKIIIYCENDHFSFNKKTDQYVIYNNSAIYIFVIYDVNCIS